MDQGGGGTIAYIMAQYNMQVIDSGVPVLNMHAPWEITKGTAARHDMRLIALWELHRHSKRDQPEFAALKLRILRRYENTEKIR